MGGRSSSSVRGTRSGRGEGRRRHDPYKLDAKLPGSAFCGSCGVSYARGRWSWAPRGAAAEMRTCPACRRIADKVPAGILRVSRDVARSFDELMHLMWNREHRERSQHPLERVLAVRSSRDWIQIETTGVHLARRLGAAIARTFHGELETEYLRGQDLARISVTPRG
ncbi:MAG: ATPase [Planctomycetes bacterium]|nr:ATPase [Planctomycetota bacterium]